VARLCACWRTGGRLPRAALAHACRDARLIAYDLLGLDGEDLRKLPLHERLKRLEGEQPSRSLDRLKACVVVSAFLAYRRYDTDPAAKLLIVLTRTIPPAQAAQKGL
jgi:hypothetical protein